MSNPKPRSVAEKKFAAMRAVKAFDLGATNGTTPILGALPSSLPLRSPRPATADKSSASTEQPAEQFPRPCSARDSKQHVSRPSSAQDSNQENSRLSSAHDSKRWPKTNCTPELICLNAAVAKRRPSAHDNATGCAVTGGNSGSATSGQRSSASSGHDNSATVLFGTEDSQGSSFIIAPEPPGPISKADALAKLAITCQRDAKPMVAKAARPRSSTGRPSTPIGSRWRPETSQGGFTHRGARTMLSGVHSPSSKHEEAEEADRDALSPEISRPAVSRQLSKSSARKMY